MELPLPAKGLEMGLNRRIMEFHKSRHIEPRFGRLIYNGNRTNLGGALPIWGPLVTSLNSSVGRWRKLVFEYLLLTLDETRRSLEFRVSGFRY